MIPHLFEVFLIGLSILEETPFISSFPHRSKGHTTSLKDFRPSESVLKVQCCRGIKGARDLMGLMDWLLCSFIIYFEINIKNVIFFL